MTNDYVASPKRRRSAPPKLAWTVRGRREWPEALFCSAQDGDRRATVARRAAGTGGAGDDVSIARLSEWRERALAGAATALKERERDDRDDEIARLKSKVGEITMDNEVLTLYRGAGG